MRPLEADLRRLRGAPRGTTAARMIASKRTIEIPGHYFFAIKAWAIDLIGLVRGLGRSLFSKLHKRTYCVATVGNQRFPILSHKGLKHLGKSGDWRSCLWVGHAGVVSKGNAAHWVRTCLCGHSSFWGRRDLKLRRRQSCDLHCW